MSFPRSYFKNGDPDQELKLDDAFVSSVLGHETLHQLQRANGVDVTTLALGLQIKGFFGADPYKYKHSTDPDEMLSTFLGGNVEQQGQIFQDYIYDLLTNLDVSRYSKIAGQVKGNCTCHQ
jgi:hypothetical protein